MRPSVLCSSLLGAALACASPRRDAATPAPRPAPAADSGARTHPVPATPAPASGRPAGRARHRFGAAARAAGGGLRARLDAAREHGRGSIPSGASRLRRAGRAHRHSRHRHRSRRARPGDHVDRRARRSSTCAISPARARCRSPGSRPRGDSVTVGGRTARRIRPGRGAQHRRARTMAAPSPRSRSARRRPPTSTATARCAIPCRSSSCGPRDGWVLLADTDGDGSLAGERPIHDFLIGARDLRLVRQGGRAQGEPRRELLRRRRRAPARSVLRHRLPRHPRRGHRRGPRHLRRVGVRRRRARARSSSASRSPTARRAGSRPPGSMLRGDRLRHPLRRSAPAPAGAQPQLRGGQRDRRAGADRSAGRFRAARHPDGRDDHQRRQRRARPLDHRVSRQRDAGDQRRRHAAGRVPAARPRPARRRRTCSPTSARAAARPRARTS